MILRSPIKYYGGKGLMAAKLLKLIPKHHVYVEAFAGGASLFFLKPPSPIEVLNDIDQSIANLFRVLQEPSMFLELQHRIRHTLYSRADFIRAIEINTADPDDNSAVMRAWAKMVLQNQAFSGNTWGAGRGYWGRSFTIEGGMAGTTNSWLRRLSMLPDWHRRLLMAQVDSNDAIEVIRYWDTTDTFFYLDPPYIADTREKNGGQKYKHETSDNLHRLLVDTILPIKGKAMLSGYAHPLYDRLIEGGWHRLDFSTSCNAAVRSRGSGLQGKGKATEKVPCTESVWVNYNPGAAALPVSRQEAFNLEA